jgi:(p)ppGpp synthase/HD superfamily hydrolase
MYDINCWKTKFKPCCYSERLLTKISLINKIAERKVDLLEIKKAIYYTKKYHGSQMRQSGQPYYSHPLEVAYNIADHIFKTDILVTSILHDTLEDTELTMGMIDTIFGSNVAAQVEGLTRVKADRKISSAETVKLLSIQNKYELLLIKWFDRLHNMQTIAAKPLEKKIKITKETFEKFMSLGMYFESNIPNLNTDIIMVNLCYQQLMPNYYHQTINLMKSCEDNFELPSLSSRNVEIRTKIL